MPRLVLLLACAKRKCATPTAEARHATLIPDEAKPLAARWLARIAPLVPTFAAGDLYKGASWSTYHAVLSKLNQIDADGNVGNTPVTPNVYGYALSAGFGVVPLTKHLPPYSATFAEGEDSIADMVSSSQPLTRAARHRLWWNALTQMQGNSCADLAEKHPDARFVVVGGGDYVEALRDDLGCLKERVGRERLFIISAGYSPTPGTPLVDCLIPTPPALRALLPGALVSLNARILSWLFAQAVLPAGWNHAAIVREIDCFCNKDTTVSASTLPVKRISVSDAIVHGHIRTTWSETGKVSASRLLRRLRDEGFACEEKRFRGLYELERASQVSDETGNI